MSTKQIKNLSASIRQRLSNLANKQGEPFQVLSNRYVLERLLYRLSKSSYANQFVLKGAMLFTVWSNAPLRTTRDLDMLALGNPDQETTRDIIVSIINQPVEDDGVIFDEASIRIEEIRALNMYNGFRIRLNAYLGKMEIPVQMDLGFGDIVTPGPEELSYPALLDFPAPQLRVYPPESVIAEKVQAMVALSIANSRMKDYYDLAVILRQFRISSGSLSRAIAATFERRGTEIPGKIPDGLSDEFARDRDKKNQWQLFMEQHTQADAGKDLIIVVRFLREKLMPVFDGLIKQYES